MKFSSSHLRSLFRWKIFAGCRDLSGLRWGRPRRDASNCWESVSTAASRSGVWNELKCKQTLIRRKTGANCGSTLTPRATFRAFIHKQREIRELEPRHLSIRLALIEIPDKAKSTGNWSITQLNVTSMRWMGQKVFHCVVWRRKTNERRVVVPQTFNFTNRRSGSTWFRNNLVTNASKLFRKREQN